MFPIFDQFKSCFRPQKKTQDFEGKLSEKRIREWIDMVHAHNNSILVWASDFGLFDANEVILAIATSVCLLTSLTRRRDGVESVCRSVLQGTTVLLG